MTILTVTSIQGTKTSFKDRYYAGFTAATNGKYCHPGSSHTKLYKEGYDAGWIAGQRQAEDEKLGLRLGTPE